ncbi:hypothetical protein [Amycolatopsis tucumanensis]|uniref:Lipoprotein n=1 Tax=Amycolatopsis tucumanensis TaxID=401106 RepID=A0ABP7IWI6_9PSEU|nr:hypothetical protein [Amycolatopsis tucumanensis]MCF6427327.1 hypothetical protein [Amycolatopsis tucumanensis]
MRPGKSVFLVVLTGLCVGLSGCGQQPARNVEPGGPGLSREQVQLQDAATRWADDYCVAVGSLVQGLATMPSVDPSSPQRAVRTSSELLGSVIGGLDRALDGLGKLPPSPVPGGDQVRAQAVTDFQGVRDRASAAQQRLDSTDASEIDEATLGQAHGPLDEVSRLDLLNRFDAVPELATAIAHAPVCQQLTVQVTAAPR